MNNGDKTTFWDFLKEYSICIPIIQRDYAQGRKDKTELRRRFLKNLKEALSNHNASMTLDFAYGSKDGTTFYPLDGQQRLTTLWLLHWFIAYKAGKLKDSSIIKTLKKFSYATRVSARDFCNKLCELTPLPPETDIVDHIENQNWFYSNWKQDPTIQSMLRMLRGSLKEDNSEKTDDAVGIDGVFGCQDANCVEKQNSIYESYWDKLTTTPCIQFRVLNISEIGQTDDLYVKMNARGKPLTSFENFKAELLNYIHQQTLEQPEQRDRWINLDSPNGFGNKLDNAWTDIFWQLRSEDKDIPERQKHPERQNHIDEIFFVFFNRFFYNCYAICADNNENSNKYWRKHPLYGNDTNLDFANLNLKYYGKSNEQSIDNKEKLNEDNKINIPIDYFKDIETILDNLPKLQEKLKNMNVKFNDIIKPCWEKESMPYFLPEYVIKDNKLKPYGDNNEILEVTGITIEQRAVFFAICKWFIKNQPNNNGYSDEQVIAFKDWIRVIWNIVENSNAGNYLPDALKLIDELSKHSGNILMFIASDNKIKSDFASEQLNEEREKARQIMGWRGNHGMKDGAWYSRIKEAEKYAFFHGCIRFLYRNDNGQPNWCDFGTKWENAQMFFDKGGVSSKYRKDGLLLKLLYLCMYEYEKNYSYSDWLKWSDWLNWTAEIWRKLLVENFPGHKTIHNMLLTNRNPSEIINEKKECINLSNGIFDYYKEILWTILFSEVIDIAILKFNKFYITTHSFDGVSFTGFTDYSSRHKFWNHYIILSDIRKLMLKKIGAKLAREYAPYKNMWDFEYNARKFRWFNYTENQETYSMIYLAISDHDCNEAWGKDNGFEQDENGKNIAPSIRILQFNDNDLNSQDFIETFKKNLDDLIEKQDNGINNMESLCSP